MADNFLKWYPERAMTSPRWRTLSLEQKGLFHELYDFAATCDPRGTLSMSGFPMGGAELAQFLGVPQDRFNALFLPMLKPPLSLIKQSSKGRFMFPDWPRHQRNAPFRTRFDGAAVAQEWREVGATDIEGEKEGDIEREKEGEGKGESDDSPAEVIKAWNQLGSPFPKIVKITDERKRKLKTRLAASWWSKNWRAALLKIKESPFCRGENDRGWKADLTFFLRPDTVAKAIEGLYDARTRRDPLHSRKPPGAERFVKVMNGGGETK